MKILLLDIETAPNVAHVWGLWNQNVSTKQLIDSGYVMCWSAKWLGDNTIMHSSLYVEDKEVMLIRIHNLLDQADAVIHYNGTKFDIPTLNKEFIQERMTPPSPYKQIDLLQTARRQFRFPSNKLDYIAQALGVGKKLENSGHELWIRCMAGEAASWEEMEEYNKHDVAILEKVYYKLRPWIRNHANYSLYEDDSFVCPNCGSKHYHRRGFQFTNACKYQRYQCQSCGNWFRGTKSEAPKPARKFVNVN